MLYGRLDDLREQTSRRLARVLLESGGTPQARSERDTATAMHSSDLAQYSAVENGLCFGRLDFDDGEHQHIGRIGIFRTEGDYEPLLMDWRAPAARPFYLATAASPDGVTRRRHIRSRRRNVVGLDDEVLDLAKAVPGRNEGLTGEAPPTAAGRDPTAASDANDGAQDTSSDKTRSRTDAATAPAADGPEQPTQPTGGADGNASQDQPVPAYRH